MFRKLRTRLKLLSSTTTSDLGYLSFLIKRFFALKEFCSPEIQLQAVSWKATLLCKWHISGNSLIYLLRNTSNMKQKRFEFKFSFESGDFAFQTALIFAERRAKLQPFCITRSFHKNYLVSTSEQGCWRPANKVVCILSRNNVDNLRIIYLLFLQV